jgi:CO dehydrogenase maturation factor
MATTIAISGKGGSGKTTLAALIIRMLMDKGAGSILAVDADPNACLGMTMGLEVIDTIAGLREQARSKTPGGGMDRVRSFEYGIQQVITEARGYDMVTMGRPEGPDCYCAANNLLRKFMDKLSHTYQFVVLDNEAGMEHLSRRTTNHVDLLIIVADATPVGEMTAKRIFELTQTLPIEVKKIGIIWNRSDKVKNVDSIESFGYVPYDESVLEAAKEGQTIFELERNNAAMMAVQQILEIQLNI